MLISLNTWDPTLHNNSNNNNNNNNNISSAINHRIHTGTNAIMDCVIYRVSNLLRKGAKCEKYKILISTAVLYGCQSWTITNADEGKLSISDRTILRKVYDQLCTEEKKNYELYCLYKHNKNKEISR
jgi:hypothetical protein